MRQNETRATGEAAVEREMDSMRDSKKDGSAGEEGYATKRDRFSATDSYALTYDVDSMGGTQAPP